MTSDISQALQVLEQLETAGTGRNAKLSILKAAEGNLTLQNLLRLTYDWHHTFGVTVPEGLQIVGSGNQTTEENFSMFLRLTADLAARRLTGNQAKDKLQFFLQSVPPTQAKWYTRILNRDLQVGVSVKTINKVWPQLVPTFEPMAANEAKLDQLQFPVYMEPKIDGMRMLFFIYPDRTLILSRGAKEYPQLQFIADQLRDWRGIGIYDGEMLATVWNETVSLVRTLPENCKPSQLERQKTHLFFHCFDYLPIENDSTLEWNQPQTYRLTVLSRSDKTQTVGSNVKLVPAVLVKSREELDAIYEQYLTQGFEGAMLKNPNGPYESKRSDYWLKLKPTATIDGEIIEVLQGNSPSTRNVLGRFKVRLENGDEVYCGSGFTKDQRRTFWGKRHTLVHQWIEMKVQDDKNKVAKIRFPVFVKLREDLPKGK